MSQLPYGQAVLETLDEGLAKGSHFRLRVTSDSMAPTLMIGDWLIVRPVPASGLKIGDIIVVRIGGGLQAHRLVAINKAGYHTKGDNVSFLDPPLDRESIIGVVTTIERAGSSIDLHKRAIYQRLLARLGRLESKGYNVHPVLRYPFKLLARAIAHVLK